MAARGKFLEAIAAVTSFHCLLRVGEMCNLRKRDVALEGDLRLGVKGFQGGLRLGKTKTGENKWVSLEDADVKALLRVATSGIGDGDRVFPFSAASFRNLIKTCCADLGIKTNYVPHSFRHGGATQLALNKVPIEDIMLRGRWASSKSAKHYIQSGNALLLLLETPKAVLKAADKLTVNIALALHRAYAASQSGRGRSRVRSTRC